MKTMPFEYVLTRSAEWLEDARLLGAGKDDIVLLPDHGAKLLEGLRIITSNLAAMERALDPMPVH